MVQHRPPSSGPQGSPPRWGKRPLRQPEKDLSMSHDNTALEEGQCHAPFGVVRLSVLLAQTPAPQDIDIQGQQTRCRAGVGIAHGHLVMDPTTPAPAAGILSGVSSFARSCISGECRISDIPSSLGVSWNSGLYLIRDAVGHGCLPGRRIGIAFVYAGASGAGTTPRMVHGGVWYIRA